MFDPKTRFLVVDDVLLLRRFVVNALKELGFHSVVEFENGKQALDALITESEGQNPIQFVLSDWNMPELSGIELLEKIRAHPQLKELPFLMVTTEGDKEKVLTAIKKGASHYLVKPFQVGDLGARLQWIYSKIHENNKS